MTYQVGVDPGTGHTTMAVFRDGSVRSTSAVASTVFVGDDGAFLVGEAAERRALTDPARVVREAVRRIGDPTPLLVGRQPVAAEALVARLVAGMLREVAAREGAAPERVAVTHPAGWGEHKVAALRSALTDHGIGRIVMVPAPLATAVGCGAGAVTAVYDLGAGTFDAAVVRLTGPGAELPATRSPSGSGPGEWLLGRPEGLDRLGGADIDDLVVEHVRRALGPAWDALDASDPAVLAAVARLRRECTAAKEALSVDTEVSIPVLLPGTHTTVRLGRAEFEDAIRPVVAGTVEVLLRAIASAGLTPADLTDVVLAGGSSRIPLVAELVSGGLGRPVAVAVDPTVLAARGAALVAAGLNNGGAVGSPAAARPPGAGRGVVATGPPADQQAGPSVAPRPTGSADRRSPAQPADVARPPKQARPFASASATGTQPRAAGLILAAGLLLTVLAGGAVVVGVAQLGNSAGATTPTTTVTRTTEPTTAPESVVAPPPDQPAPVPPRRTAAPPRPVPPAATTTRAPATTAPASPPSTTPPATSAPQPADQPTTQPPAPTSAAAAGAGASGEQEGGRTSGAATAPAAAA